MKKTLFATLAVSALTASFFACKALKQPEARPDAVTPFSTDRYLGKWYEICRLDFKWEKDLSRVTALYSLRDNGTIEVKNTGFHDIKKKWQESIGKAKPIDNPNSGSLKVSFFGPFYSGYHVVKIDPEYKYALVFGESLDYMWILSREKTIPEEIKVDYLKYALSQGYDIEKLIWTQQD